MKLKMIILSASMFMLTGCAALEQMHQEWVKENCNPSAAFNAGVADGLNPNTMPKHSFASSCPDNHTVINDAYMQGFAQGLQKRPQQININKNVNVNKPVHNATATGYSTSASSYQNAQMSRDVAQAKADAQKAIDEAHRTIHNASSGQESFATGYYSN